MNRDFCSAALPRTHWPAFGAIFLLALLAYGQFWTRGGYADDFTFLAYSARHDYFDAVRLWGETFNSRLAQGVMMPLLHGVAGVNDPLHFNWPLVHGIALAAFLITLWLLDACLRQLRMAWPQRALVVLLFALAPAKDEALLWPATQVGYVIPAMLFLFAAWRELITLRRNDATLPGLIARHALFAFTLLAIEQLMPLYVLFVAFSAYAFRGRLRMTRITIAVIVLAAVAALTLGGKTTERANEFLTVNPASMPLRLLDVLGESLRGFLLPYADMLVGESSLVLAIVRQPTFLLSALIIVALVTTTLRANVHVPGTRGAVPRNIGIGLAIWLAALSPFVVLSYYLPNRALYLPSLGMWLIAATLLCAVCRGPAWSRWLGGSGTSLLLIYFTVANLYAQQDFTRRWQDTRALAVGLLQLQDPLPQQGELVLVNPARSHGPAPDLHNRFALDGLIRWLLPAHALHGETLRDFSTLFDLPAGDDPAGHWKLSAQPGALPLLRGGDGLHLMTTLELVRSSAGAAQPPTTQLRGVLSTLDMASDFGTGVSLHLGRLVHLPAADLALLEVEVRAPADSKGLRLILHARRDDSQSEALDSSIAARFGFVYKEGSWRRFMPIAHYSELRGLRAGISLHDQRLTPRPTHTSSGSSRVGFF